jgi:hypothetical protein
MNGIKFKWIMLFSYKHYRKWNKRSNKNWVMQILFRRQLPRKSVHISTLCGTNLRSIQVICHGYLCLLFHPPPPGANYGNKVNLELFFHNKKDHVTSFWHSLNYLVYDLSINRTIEMCELQNVLIVSEHVYFSNHCDPHLYLALFCMKYCIYGIIMFICLPIWMYTFTSPGFESTDTHSLNLLQVSCHSRLP